MSDTSSRKIIVDPLSKDKNAVSGENEVSDIPLLTGELSHAGGTSEEAVDEAQRPQKRPEFHILCTELGPYSGYSDFDPEEIGWGLHQEVRVWPQGKILEVTFSKDEKGLPQEEYEEVTSAIEEFASVWSHHGNIAFLFTDNAFEAGLIRVAFTRGIGHNSYIGTDCATAVANHTVPTMNLDPNEINRNTLHTDRGRFRQVVLHEFGHALGLTHEHSQPNVRIKLDEAKVYEFYAEKYHWSRETIEANVLRRYMQRSLLDSKSLEYDLYSIMHYDLDGVFTKDNKRVTGGKDLSLSDKRLVDKYYPLPLSGGVGTFEVKEEDLLDIPDVHPVVVPPRSLRNSLAIHKVLFGTKSFSSAGLTLVSDFDAPPSNDPQNTVVSIRKPIPFETPLPLRISWITLTSPRSDLQCGQQTVEVFYKPLGEDEEEEEDDHPRRLIEVEFPVPYPREAIPTVVAWFHSAESAQTSAKGHFFEVIVTNVNHTSFRLSCNVSVKTSYKLGITWLSYSNSRADMTSSNVTFASPKRLENQTLSQSVVFPDKLFAKPPKVFVAFSSISTYKGDAFLSADVPQHAVTPSEMTVNVHTSKKTALRKATLTCIAIHSETPKSSRESMDAILASFDGPEFIKKLLADRRLSLPMTPDIDMEDWTGPLS